MAISAVSGAPYASSMATGEASETGDDPSESGLRHTRGSAYYARNAEWLAKRYESLSFETVHQESLSFLPPAPARVADIGAGTGRDAAALTERGYEVVAVEPVARMREVAQRLHADAPVMWLEGALPHLACLNGPFDVLLVSAVWMHLAESDREPAMRRLHELLTPGGVLVLTVRHGPGPEEQQLFEVPDDETLDLARACGLRPVNVWEGSDRLGRGQVCWTRLVLSREYA